MDNLPYKEKQELTQKRRPVGGSGAVAYFKIVIDGGQPYIIALCKYAGFQNK
jgi:hypothetical protein